MRYHTVYHAYTMHIPCATLRYTDDDYERLRQVYTSYSAQVAERAAKRTALRAQRREQMLVGDAGEMRREQMLVGDAGEAQGDAGEAQGDAGEVQQDAGEMQGEEGARAPGGDAGAPSGAVSDAVPAPGGQRRNSRRPKVNQLPGGLLVQICVSRQVHPGPETHAAIGRLQRMLKAGEIESHQPYSYYLDLLPDDLQAPDAQ